MKKIVKIKLKKKIDNSYPIIISSGINLAGEIKELRLNNNYAIITDDIVYKIYKDKIQQEFSRESLNYKFLVIKHGEKSKRFKTFKTISNKMLKSGFDRQSCIIAFGGGVVGDLAGYVAGTYMRGIPFIQIPTTLLAQVDSSIGGKVAVDLKHGKNSTGLFYQPLKVIIDIDFLNTLPETEFNNGMIEVIKHGIIRNEKYFRFIEDNLEKIRNRDTETLIQLIYGSCLIKGDVVQKDEKEKDLRRILNFGHTIGHALEVIKHYKIKHGFAVGFGMIKESEISNKLGYLSENDLTRQRTILEAVGIKPIKYNKQKLLNMIKNDKKNIKLKDDLELIIPIVLPKKTGKVIIKNFTLKELENLI